MDTEAIKGFLEDFQKETDRACAILGGAYLDQVLRILLRKKLIDENKYVEENILSDSPGGILSTFSAKIRMSYSLGILSEEELRDLDLIRKIRNAFAHDLKLLRFDSKAIKQRCESLYHAKSANDLIKKSGVKPDETARGCFILSVAVIGHFLLFRANHNVKHLEKTAALDPYC